MARPRLLLRLALVLLVLGGAAFYLLTLMRPRFPDEAEIAKDLPTLRVPSAACFDAESHRMLLTTADYQTIELRLTWEPGDWKGRVRELGPDPYFPAVEPGRLERLLAWVRGNPGPPDQPAALVIAGPEDLEDLPLPPYWRDGAAPVYLGGRTPDGKIGAVPFQAEPVILDELFRSSGNSYHDPDGTLLVELRITREEDQVRYRWGPATFFTARDVGERFSGGDESFSADEVAGPGTGPLLPALAERLARGRPAEHPLWKTVLLEIGTGVRYVDILRAVECAPGDPGVTFVLFPSRQRELQQLRLPTPPADGAPVLTEALDHDGRRLVVNILPGGAIYVKKAQQTLESLREQVAEFGPEAQCHLRVHRDNLMKSVVPVIALLRAAGLDVVFCLDPLDPALRIETTFALSPGNPAEPPVQVTLTRTEQGLRPDRGDIADRPVRVLLPDDATVEEALHALIHLKLAGAIAFEFE